MDDPLPLVARPVAARDDMHPPMRWGANAAGDHFWFSPEWNALTGLSTEEIAGDGWLACIHPQDRGRMAEGMRQARSHGFLSADLRVCIQRSGTYGLFRVQARPTGDAASDWAGTAVDISDFGTRLTDADTLRAALHHRIRNTLAVIRSMARRTAENSETVEDYRNHFEGRLAAFARTQSHIMRTGTQGVDLEALLADELLANQVGGRVTYSGPEVRLPARLADQLGIALHELTDNAVQYGALRRDDGRLDVRWWTAGDAPARTLHLDWREDVPGGGIVPPETEGFGLELLTRSLQYEVDAQVDLVFAPDGLTCLVVVPLD